MYVCVYAGVYMYVWGVCVCVCMCICIYILFILLSSSLIVRKEGGGEKEGRSILFLLTF